MKVNLEKEYDRIEWNFLEQILHFLSFNHSFDELILECITSASLALSWNGRVLPSFNPTQGLRQGTFYLHTIIFLSMEVLGQIISKSVEQKQWRPIRLARNCPCIYLMFSLLTIYYSLVKLHFHKE